MENTKRCLNCGFDARQEAKFCPRCGSNQFQAPLVHCPVCGADVPQSRYCAHCGSDLKNPGAQVWHNCTYCGAPVHITYTNCNRCGASTVPPVQPKQQPKKKKRGALALLLVIPLLLLLVGIVIGVMAYLDGNWPSLQVPATVPTQWEDVPTTQGRLPGTTAGKTDPDKETTAPTAGTPTGPDDVGQTTQPVTQPDTQPPTQAPTEPTQPQEPTILDLIPSSFADNYFLSAVEDGYCETMTGTVTVLVVFVSDPTDVWTQAQIDSAKQVLGAELDKLKDNANLYSADLDLNVGYGSVTITTEFDRDSTAWKEAAMSQAGMLDGYYDQRKLEAKYSADEVPVVFVLAGEGRAFANSYSAGKGFESVVIYQNDLQALRHELCHLFGAKDMYFVKEAQDAAELYLPGGIMFGDCVGMVDELTAFIMGWTDTLSDNAISFLWSTNHLTKEYIEAEQAKDQLTGYGTKEYDNGVYVGYMEFGVPNGEGSFTYDDGTVYTGTWVNGKRNGKGTMTWANGSVYVGDWVDGERTGQGTMTWDDGTVYTGAWVAGQRVGYGEQTNTAGYSYKGYWQDDKQNGTGTVVYTDGDTYTGDFVAGERHGKGTYVWPNGAKYEGDWVEGEWHGQGTYTWADGTVYTGGWVNSNREGYGEMYDKEGFSYQGYWKSDMYHGNGTVVYSNGNSYTGAFANDMYHGQGTFTWADGTVYVGAWANGDREGKGTMTWADGSYYTGDYVDGLRHGQGTYTWADGTVYVGAWVNGDRTGKGTMTWSDGSYYTGDWKDGVQHGDGEWYYATYGTRYVGQFANGKRHGYGTYYYADGTSYTGNWENGQIAD